MMKALCFIKPGLIRFQNVPKPKLIHPTDVIGKFVMGTICGSDLHLIHGGVPLTTNAAAKQGEHGLILGHEGIIQVEQVGKEVTKVRPGDTCIVSCITPCGKCYYCRHNCAAHCQGIEGSSMGIALGSEIDGTQAEFVRIPFGDNSLYKVPKGVPLENCMMLSDIIPTSYELGILDGNVQKGSRIAIVGLGPIGLAALLSAKALDPGMIIAIDLDDNRLKMAKDLGADYVINPSKENPGEFVKKLPPEDGKLPGLDTAIECVGSPATFEMCQDMIGPLGTIANIGIHPKPAKIAIQNLWPLNMSIKMGIVSAYSIPDLMDKVVAGKLDPSPLVTHHFKFSEFMKAYDVFERASETGAIKLAITPD